VTASRPNDERCRLVLKHVMPANVIVRDLLRRPPSTVAALARILYRGIEHTVMTPVRTSG